MPVNKRYIIDNVRKLPMGVEFVAFDSPVHARLVNGGAMYYCTTNKVYYWIGKEIKVDGTLVEKYEGEDERR